METVTRQWTQTMAWHGEARSTKNWDLDKPWHEETKHSDYGMAWQGESNKNEPTKTRGITGLKYTGEMRHR